MTNRELADQAEARVEQLRDQVREVDKRISWLRGFGVGRATKELSIQILEAEAEFEDLRRELDAAQITAQAARAVVE